MVLIKHFLWNPLLRKTNHPQQIQSEVLKQILLNSKDTVFGKTHGFANMNAYQDFCAAVPVQSYEDLRPYIEKQEEEKTPYLYAEQPGMYAQTSGTTGKPKYIAILESSISQYRKSQHIFAYAQYAGLPGVYSGKILAIVSPAVEGYLESGTAYGSMSGLIYKSMPRFVRSKYVIPPELFEVEDYEIKYYLITAFALAEKNITLMGTANPSTILKIANVLEYQSASLIRDIRRGSFENLKTLSDDVRQCINHTFTKNASRAIELEQILYEKKRLGLSDIWPNLRAVSTWTGGSCAVLISSLKTQLPKTTRIVELGYLSTEFRGNITIDILNNKAIPTLDTNFFEFVEKEDWESEKPDFLTLEQIEIGKQYFVLVTTPNGLYRYDINDIIEVTGKHNRTPTFTFVQKGKGVTNITGEKLYETQLVQALEAARQKHLLDIDFFIMLADPEKLQYKLYVEHEPIDATILLGTLEHHLSDLNIEYETKRKSGRLKPLCLKFLRSGAAEAYKRHSIETGQREGQFKVVHLQYKKDCTFDIDKHIH